MSYPCRERFNEVDGKFVRYVSKGVWRSSCGNIADSYGKIDRGGSQEFFLKSLSLVQEDEEVRKLVPREFDLLQSRYGWHDEYVHSMPFHRYQEKVDIATEREREQQLIKAGQALATAHVSWVMSAAWGGEKRKFKEHLKMLGLYDDNRRAKRTANKVDRKEQAKRAYEKADNIVSMLTHKRKKQAGGGED